MTNNLVFNPTLSDQHTIDTLRSQFNSALPFRNLVIDDFLVPGLAQSILAGFPPLDTMKTHYSGINEKKAEHNDLSRLDKSFTTLHEALSSPDFIGWISAITGIAPLQTMNDRLGFGLHQGGNRSFLDIHIDY